MPTNTPREPRPPEGIHPIVRTANGGNFGFWAFLVLLVIGGVLLFQALDARRISAAIPSVTIPASISRDHIAAPPQIALPSRFTDATPDVPPQPNTESNEPNTGESNLTATRTATVSKLSVTPKLGAAGNRSIPFSVDSSRGSNDFEGDPDAPAEYRTRTQQSNASTRVPHSNTSLRLQNSDDRVLATRLSNPSLTVPKGTIIPAVLESAVDSARPGAVRAIVSRDIMGFDGTRILIPRGSRLIGEYGADIKPGQNRALVVWTRLMRPDAVIINLDSPAADPLGKAGIEGETNTHFFARFGSAILQSVLDLGVGVGTQAVTKAASNNTTIVSLSSASTPKISDQTTEVQPTLTIDQGRSLSVFVAHDLDFSTVDN